MSKLMLNNSSYSLTGETGTITFNPSDYVTSAVNPLEEKLKELEARMNRTVSLVHNCKLCGATLEIDEHKQIVYCKYCGGTYLVGTVQLNSTY